MEPSAHQRGIFWPGLVRKGPRAHHGVGQAVFGRLSHSLFSLVLPPVGRLKTLLHTAAKMLQRGKRREKTAACCNNNRTPDTSVRYALRSVVSSLCRPASTVLALLVQPLWLCAHQVDTSITKKEQKQNVRRGSRSPDSESIMTVGATAVLFLAFQRPVCPPAHLPARPCC